MKKFICALLTSTLLLVPAFSIGASAAIPTDNMIALYTMEGDFKDEISGKDGTLMNGASVVADADRGNVLALINDDVESPGNGLGYESEGQHAILADSHIPDSDTMSISVWFKIKDDYRNWARVIDMGDARAEFADSPNRFINISPTNGTNTIGTVNVNDGAEYGFDVENNRDRVFADLVDVDKWIHAVLVIDATDDKPNVLYLNGVPFESTHGGDEYADKEASAFSPKDILEAVDGIGKTYLGRSRFENNGDQIFNGWIDDVSIFDIALTADQVTELMNTTSANLLPNAATEETEEPATEAPATEAEQSDAVATEDDASVVTEETPVAPVLVTAASVAAPQTGNMTVAIIIAALLISGCAALKLRKANTK